MQSCFIVLHEPIDCYLTFSSSIFEYSIIDCISGTWYLVFLGAAPQPYRSRHESPRILAYYSLQTTPTPSSRAAQFCTRKEAAACQA
jgi:hypothetical protein